ncbi:MAG: hypothetical protein IGNPGNKH_00712 [Sodalis sp. Ffu]|nr:MAG: hypothetical protein CMIDDMOC_00870 [Sodalis sp. Fle]UVK79223.1 MAG: hypothetical protein IGNPGNKH_00712 [Sodalis sp. Ffu]
MKSYNMVSKLMIAAIVHLTLGESRQFVVVWQAAPLVNIT